MAPLWSIGTAAAQGKATAAPPKASTSASAAPAVSAAPAPSASGSAAPAGTGVAPPPGAAGGGTLDGATYAVRLRDLEQRINELKEQIRKSHTRLALLSESVLGGVTAAARAEITFVNEMSSAYKLKRVVALYDGSPLATKTDEKDGIAEQKEIQLYAELVQPGDHTLQILLEYQGSGYGVFSYLKGYKFEVRSSRTFTALEGKTISIRIIGYEQGGPTTPFEERPAVQYKEKITAGAVAGGAAGAKKPESK
ncbi:MAG: hypothetical protein JST00_43940 [Deltaproteobacteria bacterium]|nr:hypothetical protein [Deltaproteobacteria bacterium]